MRTTTIRLLALTAIAVSTAPVDGQDTPLQGLDQHIEAAMVAWNVPALAVAIVKDDRVVHAQGYGVLTLGEEQRVDENTIFGIGSTTKAFTAAALGMLVDEGRLHWDDRVVDHLKDFRLYDPYATANITIRDLLSHTSGLSRGDRMWYTRHFDRAEVVKRVRHQEPSWSFRQQYGYSNTMYTAAGLVVEAATGQSWDDFVEQRLFRPLGMARTNSTIRGLDERANVVSYYTAVDGKPAAIPRWSQDNIGPAGSINSSAADLAQWVRLQLAEGKIDGQPLISADRIREMHEAQVAIRGEVPSFEPAPWFNAYGLGWRLRDYHGRKLVWHGGGGHGVSAQIALVPEDDLGVVVLTNMDGHNLSAALVFHVIDAFLDAPRRDWSTLYLASRDSALARAATRERWRAEARVRGTTPSRPLDDYVGKYWHPYYDTAEVWLKDDQLYFRFVSDIEGPLEHWHYDTFRGHWEHARYGKNFLTFLLDADGAVGAVRVPPEWDTSILVDFKKLPPEAAEPKSSPRRDP